MTSCFSCGTVLPPTFFRGDRCPECGSDVRVCLNCTFYEPSAHWECHEVIPERVADKDRANFCDYFRPRQGNGKTDAPPRDARNSARDDFNKLFGG